MTTCFASGQYANEWIDYDKTHYKFNISETGIYRISFEILQQTNIDLIGEHFQLFYKGEEIPIYVTTESTFAQDDYIEFYGEMNDGTFDTQLYAEPDHQIQNNKSLFSDISAYYLTSNPSGNNKRFEATENDISNPPEKEFYFMYESEETYTDFFNYGPLYYHDNLYNYGSLPTFVKGEGFVSKRISNLYSEEDYNYDGIIDTIIYNTGVDFSLLTNNIYLESNEKARIQTRLVGKGSNGDRLFSLLKNKAEISIAGTAYLVDSFYNHQIKQYEFDVDVNAMAGESDDLGNVLTNVNFKAVDGVEPTLGVEYRTSFSVSSLSIEYPRNFNFNNYKYFQFNLEIDTVKYFELENFNGANNVVLYDLTNAKRVVPIYEAGVHKFKINPTDDVKRKFALINANIDNSAIRKVANLKEKMFTNYSDLNNQGNYIIITNKALREGGVDQIDRYENYRESELGGMHSVVAIDVEELYDQFAWGIDKHPMAIKNFVNFTIDNWVKQAQFLCIIGKGTAYHLNRLDIEENENCLVPTYGNSYSDFLFTTKSTQDFYTKLALGRIPARTSEDVKTYLDKVIEYEDQIYQTKSCDKIEARAWMKNSIHIAKGIGHDETDEYKEYRDVYKNILSNDCLGYSSVREFEDHIGYSAMDLQPYFSYSDELKVHLESGISFINYFGKSTSQGVGLNGTHDFYWQFDMPLPTEYNNKGKYPFILSNASLTCNINGASNKYRMSEVYVLAKKGGAIGFLGPINVPPYTLMHSFSEQLVQNFSTEFYGQTIGECLQKTKQNFYDTNRFETSLICNEYTLAADPAIKLYHWAQPEYLLKEESLSLSPTENLDPANVNELAVSFELQNWGKSNSTETVEVVISQYDDNDNLINQYIETIQSPVFETRVDFTIPLAVNSPSGMNKFVIEVDGNRLYSEDCIENNIAERTLAVSNSYLGACTDQCAENFNPDAVYDDGSCLEYDNTCNVDCTNGDLTEWDEEACDCVTTTVTHIGCTDATAENYDPESNCDDGSCNFEGVGINDINAFDLDVDPSPTNSIMNFHMELTTASNIKIELFTVNGKLIDVITNDFYQSGKTTITYSVSSLNSGVYLYKMNDGKDDLTGKITVVK